MKWTKNKPRLLEFYYWYKETKKDEKVIIRIFRSNDRKDYAESEQWGSWIPLVNLRGYFSSEPIPEPQEKV